MAKLFLTLIGCLCLALPARAADPPRTDAFVAQVAGGNTFEIESSKLALAKSKAEPVRAFATQMVADHTDAGAKFKKALTEARLQSPPEAMDAMHKAVFDGLQKQDAATFDKAYVEAQYKAHVETVELFEAYARGGDNPRLKQFAQELLPTLRRHLEHIKEVRGRSSA